MRLRKKHWATPELKENEYIYFDPVDKKGKWHETFGNENPIYLELGAGRGSFSLKKAEENPNINYLPLEIETNVFVYAGRLYKEKGLKNILGIRGAAEKLFEFFEEDEVDRIYINFCNPWPKPRQHKRRLSHPRLLNLYKVILKNGGEIELKTDDRPFFEDTVDYFKEEGFEILNIDYDLGLKEGDTITEYESKWRSMEVPICYIRVKLNK